MNLIIGSRIKSGMMTCLLVSGLFIGCSPIQKVAFTGTWVQQQYQKADLDVPTFESRINVVSDRVKFRIATVSLDNTTNETVDTLEIYDGKFITTHSQARPGAETSTAPYKSKIEATDPLLENLRFWLRTPVPHEVVEEGESILGHETILYLAFQRRPGSKFESRQYVDKKTGIVLRNVITVKDDSGRVIAEGLYDCVEIKYDVYDKNAFTAEFGGA